MHRRRRILGVLARFLTTAELPGGRFECHAPTDGFEVARELLLPRPPGVVPAGDPELRGVWYGVLGETIVSVMLVQPLRGSGPAVLYRTATSSGSSGAIFPVTTDGRGFVLRLANQSTITAHPKSDGAMTIVWKSAGDAPSNFSRLSATPVTRLEGELRRAPEEF